ncbi:MAG: hypothetical protein QNJ05_05815 [Woeseiaceae bacterium]|nr:hypothetical protein [Woeseiaceae bacterium]
MTILQHLPVLACTGFALLLSRRAGLLPSIALFVVTGLVLFVLFASVLVGLLLPATVLILAAGALAMIYESYRLYAAKSFPPLPLIVFLILSVIFWIAHYDASFFYFDAFSHWGIFLREMLASDGVWGADSNSVHPKYPPGPTLWQYTFARFSLASEGAAFHAQFVLLITPLMVLFEGIRSRMAIWVVLITILLAILLFNFGHGIQSVYVDHILGTWVAGALVAFIAMLRRSGGWELLWLAVPVAAMCLLKTVGVFFVLVVAGCMFMAGIGHWLANRSPAPMQNFVVASAAVLLALVATVVWNANQGAAGIEATRTSTDGIVANLASGESKFSDAERAVVSARFIDVVMNQQISKSEVSHQFHAFNYEAVSLYTESFRLTTVTLLLISLGFIPLAYARLAGSDIRLGWAACGATLWLGTVAYLGMLYVGYVYVSGSDNAFILSSYIRYSHSLFLPLIILLVVIAFPVLGGATDKESKTDKKSLTNLGVVTALTLLLIVFETPYLKYLYTTHRSPDIRFAIEPTAASIRDRIGDASLQVFVDFNDPNGFLRHMMRYQLTPGRTSVDLVDPSFISDTAQFLADNATIDYVWIAAGDPALLSAVASASGNEAARVFRVNRETDAPLLIPVSFAGPDQ